MIAYIKINMLSELHAKGVEVCDRLSIPLRLLSQDNNIVMRCTIIII
ncbi:hypothetical protein AT1219_70159 [Vibrio alginolyticus]